jgi:uncharacterized protein
MQWHSEFEWDPAKAADNHEKHGVTFEHAAVVLGDEHAEVYQFEDYDSAHSMDEDRYRTVASHPQDRSIILLIVWTRRPDADGPVTRIISARVATRRERKLYAEALAQTQAGPQKRARPPSF